MTLDTSVNKLIEEFNWDYISGRMHGDKWDWFNNLQPTVPDLIKLAQYLGKRLEGGNYISSGGITFEKDADTVTLWFGKKKTDTWKIATERYV